MSLLSIWLSRQRRSKAAGALHASLPSWISIMNANSWSSRRGHGSSASTWRAEHRDRTDDPHGDLQAERAHERNRRAWSPRPRIATGSARPCAARYRTRGARGAAPDEAASLELARSVATASRESAAGTGPRAVPAPALARLRLADVDLAAANVAAVQRRDGLVGLARRAHLDEAETARAARLTVRDDRCRLARPVLREERLEVRAGGVEREVSDEDLLAHGLLLPR